MSAKSLILVLSCLFLVTACDEKSPTGPTVPLNQQFTLAPGDVATVQDTSMRIQFVAVQGDSRCPADAICIWGGDALVLIRVTDGSSNDYELHTGDQSRAAVMHRGLRIALVHVQPYPFSNKTIEPHEYRATLTVTR